MPEEDDSAAFVDAIARHDPFQAVAWGLAFDVSLPSLGPEWWEERNSLWRSARSSADRLLAAVATHECQWMDAQEHLRSVHATIDSPTFAIRQCLDELPLETSADVERYTAALESVPLALAGLTQTLSAGIAAGKVAAVRQVLATAEAAEQWSPGALTAALAQEVRAALPVAQEKALDTAARRAAVGFGDFAAYLRGRYAPQARSGDAVGEETYGLWAARYFAQVPDNGWYDWAQGELPVILADLSRARSAVEEAGPSMTVEGKEAHRDWAALFVDQALGATSAVVPLPSGVGPPEVRLMAEGGIGSYAAYYSPPAHGNTSGVVWIDASDGPHYVEYEKVLLAHEGVPGHHAETTHQCYGEPLTAFQRVAYLPVHSEGWGLYSEQVADEAGLFDTPHSRAGYLGSLALRVASLLVDMGMHCNFPRADGGQWDTAAALATLESSGLDDAAASWLTNILGRPGHRSTYAVGKYVWLDARGAAFDRGRSIAEFHVEALRRGPCTLADLRTA